MKEITLRKTHRNLGLTLAFFLLLQGGSGLLLTIGELFEPETRTRVGESHGHAGEGHQGVLAPTPETHAQQRPYRQVERHGLVGQLHHGKGMFWNLYRLVVGSGLLALLTSGVAIFLMSRARNVNNSPS